MPVNHTGNTSGLSFGMAVTITVPVDGDTLNAASVTVALDKLADILQLVVSHAAATNGENTFTVDQNFNTNINVTETVNAASVATETLGVTGASTFSVDPTLPARTLLDVAGAGLLSSGYAAGAGGVKAYKLPGDQVFLEGNVVISGTTSSVVAFDLPSGWPPGRDRKFYTPVTPATYGGSFIVAEWTFSHSDGSVSLQYLRIADGAVVSQPYPIGALTASLDGISFNTEF